MVFEGMNTTNPELNWKAVTKGRRTRKSMARSSINSTAKVGNSPSPSGVGGKFSGSDPDLSGECVARESTYGKSNSVPLKKRKHLLQPSSPYTWTPSGRPEHESKVAGDFSGIELLAAAASMDDIIDDAKNVDPCVGHSSSPKNSDAARSSSQCKLELENDDHSQVLSISATVSHSPCGKPVIIPQLNRQHWDLNTMMDAWELPCDDSVAGNTSNDMHIDVKDPSNVARMVSDQDNEKDAGEANLDQVLSGDDQKDASNNVMNIDAVVDCSPQSELYWPSGVFAFEEKINTTSEAVAVNQSEDCSSNISEPDRITSSVNQTVIQATHDMPTCEISETAVIVPCENVKDPWKDCEPPGSVIQDRRSVLSSDSRIQNHGTCVTEHGGNELLNEGSKSNELEDSCKSSIVGAQCGDPTSSAGKIGSSVDGQRDSDVSQNHNFHAVDKDGMTKYHDEYESPYEDGEWRGSFLYSWEDNELEDEYVDYESDGRNRDGSEAVDYCHSETFEGDSGGYFGTQRRGSFAKQIPEGNGSKGGSVKQYSSMHFVKDDSVNNETGGMGSIEGSGTTFTEPMEMNKKYDFKKRRHLNDRRGEADTRIVHMDTYKPKIVRRKLQMHKEGWSSFDATDGKDVYMQQYRSRRFSASYSQPERGIYTGKHWARYRPSTHGERDGVQHPASWDSRRRNPSSFHGAEGGSYTGPRYIARDSDKMGGYDLNDPGQTADYLSNPVHRPVMRSPEEGVGYFGMQSRRMPLKQGRGNYRSRGSYRHCGGRDFVEHFEPVLDEDNIPVRYLSTKGHNFSPNSGRNAHMPLPCKRPHSKSRTRSPGPWHSHKEQKVLYTRRQSKSPDFRSEARIVRTRAAFPKPSFTSNSGEGYISSTRGLFSSPQHNCRWVDDGAFENNHSGPNRSLVRAFRHTKRFDDVGYSGRLKLDDYFRPMFRPQRFPFMANGGREYKLESNYDERRHDDSGEMIHRGSHPDGNGYVRRFRHNAAVGSETGNLNIGDVVDRRNTPKIQGERDGKSS